MPALRELLSGAGLQAVGTYLQSGNVVIAGDQDPASLAEECRDLISGHFGFDVPVIVRTGRELEAVLDACPLAAVATEPKRYTVSFLDAPLDPAAAQRLEALAVGQERVVVAGRELYAWLPGGVARSKLATALAAPAKGVLATARNWTTVAALAAMAAERD